MIEWTNGCLSVCKSSTLICSPAGPQYGSVERAWLAVMTEAEKVSELHQDVKNNLVNEDVEKVKNWQKEAYHKQMIGGFKEAKEAEEGFKKAQKPWAKKLKEVRGDWYESFSWSTLQQNKLLKLMNVEISELLLSSYWSCVALCSSVPHLHCNLSSFFCYSPLNFKLYHHKTRQGGSVDSTIAS